MARKNLDQPIGNSKNASIKFNEQIAGKYRAGLSLQYLDSYLENNIVNKSIVEFIAMNKDFQTSKYDFEYIFKTKSKKNIDWFFETVINKRDLIDYKFSAVKNRMILLKFQLKTKLLPMFQFHYMD